MERRKKGVRVVCIVLACLMALTLIAPVAATVFAEDQTPADKLEQAKQELEAIENEIDEIESSKEAAQKSKAYYEELANAVKTQIEAQNNLITAQQESINQKQEELAAKITEVESTQALFDARMKTMYVQHNRSSLSVLLGVTPFAEALRYIQNLQYIAQSDTDLINTLRTQKEELDAQIAELDAELAELEQQKADLEAQKQQYVNSVTAANNQISAAEAELEVKSEEEKELQAKYQQAYQEWVAWASDTSGSSVILDEGEFYWPVPGYYRISSDYGVGRWIYGVYDVHRGLDIPAPAGTPIYAAFGGVVSTKAHWSYGTCVKISHGGGMVTIYGHMSARAAGIADGVTVTKGQLIGYVGSTGNSTGNHLHFELDINGSPTSARPYLDPEIEAALHY